jgi:hypothetical protein
LCDFASRLAGKAGKWLNTLISDPLPPRAPPGPDLNPPAEIKSALTSTSQFVAMLRISACLASSAFLLPATAWAALTGGATDQAQYCRAAIAATERATRIPDEFLSAIGRVESGRPDGGAISPWPWTVNAAGTGHFYSTKAEAIQAVRAFLASGIKSLDIGCLQVNLSYHPDAFASLEEAFDPAANAAYAAKLLMALFKTTGSWPRAAAAFHSMTPAIGAAYQQKVLEAWATPDRPAEQGGAPVKRSRVAGQGAQPQPQPQPQLADAGGAQQAAIPPSPAPSSFGFSRRFLLPQSKPAVGRTLAAYRSTAVQLGWRPTGLILPPRP